MDPLVLATFFLSLGTFVLVLVGLVTFRLAIPRLPALIGSAARSAVMSYAFVDTSETDDKGATRTVRRPSPALVAMIDQLAPVLIGKMLQVGKSMLSKGGGKPGDPAGGGGELDIGKMLEFLPKQYRGIAAIVAPKILGGLMGGGSKGSTETATNPFLAGAK